MAQQERSPKECEALLNDFKKQITKIHTSEDLKKIFKDYAKKLHPDINKCDDKYFKELLRLIDQKREHEASDGDITDENFKDILNELAKSVKDDSEELKYDIEMWLVADTPLKLREWYENVLLKKVKENKKDVGGKITSLFYRFLRRAEEISPEFALEVKENILKKKIIIPKDPTHYVSAKDSSFRVITNTKPAKEEGLILYDPSELLVGNIESLRRLVAENKQKVKVDKLEVLDVKEDYESLFKKGMEIKNIIAEHRYKHFGYDYNLRLLWNSNNDKITIPFDERERMIKELKLINFETISELAKQAEKLFLKTHSKQPKKGSPFAVLGKIFQACGDYSKAIHYYQKAIELRPAYQKEGVGQYLQMCKEFQKKLSNVKTQTLDYNDLKLKLISRKKTKPY